MARRIEQTLNIEVIRNTTVHRMSAGDMRSGSIKRVASPVGEGLMAIQFIHEYFNQM